MSLIDSILDNIDESIVVTDEFGKILFYNKVALNLSNTIFEGALKENENIIHLIKGVRKEIVENIFQEIRKNKLAEKSFAEFVNQQGITLYLEFNYIPVLDDEGNLQYIHTFIRDNTPQKVFEKKLTTQASNTGNLIEKANAIIIGIDSRGYITDWNKHCTKITGFDKNEVYAQRFSNILLNTEEKQRFNEAISDILNSHDISNYELKIRSKANKNVILMLSSSIRTSSSGSIIGVLLVGQDVTELSEYRASLEKRVEERTHELKRALQKEKEVVEMKSRFVSIASHEFRTPLSSIQYAANFIKKNNLKLPPEEIRDKLNNIEKQIQHMTYLLDDILAYGKNEAGKIQLKLSTIDLRDFISKITEEVGHNTKNTHAIRLEFGKFPETIYTDEKLLRSILINLLNNAIKFSPESDHIVFGIHEDQEQLTFIVHDQGIGIPEEESEKIFEPFLRGKGATAIKGTGLGLSIVKKAVELLKGSIELESNPGTGTTFKVTIPERLPHT